MSRRDVDDFVIRYSVVSLVAWIFVCVIAVAASVGVVFGAERSAIDVILGSIAVPVALAILLHLTSRLVRRPPRYVIGKDGFEDHRPLSRVFVPWSAVVGMSVGRPSKGRRCIFLRLREGAAVDGEWPWWMRGWGWQPSEIRFSDWLVQSSLQEIESAIRERADVPDDETPLPES